MGIEVLFREKLQAYLADKPRGTQAAIAAEIGVSPQWMSNVVTGQRGTDEEQRRRISAAIGIDYNEFIAEAKRAGLLDAEISPVRQINIGSRQNVSGRDMRVTNNRVMLSPFDETLLTLLHRDPDGDAIRLRFIAELADREASRQGNKNR